MPTTSRAVLSLALPLALVLAACSTAGASTAPSAAALTAPAPTEEPYKAPTTPAPASPTEAPAASVLLAEGVLGPILVDANGRSLYAFTVDSEGVSACYEACAQNWPPLLADAGALSAGSGLDASMLTTVDRTDGTKQVKYGDWPLYFFAGDAAAGDTNGQGVNDVWYVVGPDGSLVGR